MDYPKTLALPSLKGQLGLELDTTYPNSIC